MKAGIRGLDLISGPISRAHVMTGSQYILFNSFEGQPMGFDVMHLLDRCRKALKQYRDDWETGDLSRLTQLPEVDKRARRR